MNANITTYIETDNSELDIQERMNMLKLESMNTKDLYLKAAKILFVEYKETPSPNRLYQLIKKGSMTTVVEVVKLFWQNMHLEMHNKIHIPDIPVNLQDLTQDYVKNIWGKALIEASKKFEQEKFELHNQINDMQQSNNVLNTKLQLLQQDYAVLLQEKNAYLEESTVKDNLLKDKNIALTQAQHSQNKLYARIAELQTNMQQQYIDFSHEKNALQSKFERNYQGLQEDIKMWQQRLDNERIYSKDQEKKYHVTLQKLNANILELKQNIQHEQTIHKQTQLNYDSLCKEHANFIEIMHKKDNENKALKLNKANLMSMSSAIKLAKHKNHTFIKKRKLKRISCMSCIS
jgi:Plasmid replication region DNA-binding N-term